MCLSKLQTDIQPEKSTSTFTRGRTWWSCPSHPSNGQHGSILKSLSYHGKLHLEYANVGACRSSGQTFNYIEGHLNQQLQKNMGERPQPCNQCNKCFIKLKNAKRHMNARCVHACTCTTAHSLSWSWPTISTQRSTSLYATLSWKGVDEGEQQTPGCKSVVRAVRTYTAFMIGCAALSNVHCCRSAGYIAGVALLRLYMPRSLSWCVGQSWRVLDQDLWVWRDTNVKY